MVGQYNRDVSKRKAERKRKLSRQMYTWLHSDYYDNLHQYSKNKIHCSCPMCSTKTRNKGKRMKKNYHRAINYKGSDMRKMISMDDQMEEFTGQKIHRKTKSW